MKIQNVIMNIFFLDDFWSITFAKRSKVVQKEVPENQEKVVTPPQLFSNEKIGLLSISLMQCEYLNSEAGTRCLHLKHNFYSCELHSWKNTALHVRAIHVRFL